MLEAADKTGRSDRSVRCEHLCETTSRYDHGEKELSFLLFCALCGTEELVERIRYEPQFTETRESSDPGSVRPGTSASRTGVSGRWRVRFP
jgi:hypothetical protein